MESESDSDSDVDVAPKTIAGAAAGNRFPKTAYDDSDSGTFNTRLKSIKHVLTIHFCIVQILKMKSVLFAQLLTAPWTVFVRVFLASEMQ